MRKGKLELALYYFFDHTWIEKHFEEMARKGWALERMGVFWHYQKIQPQDLHYAVAYFSDGKYYKPPSEGEKTFEEYCAAAGWNEVAEYGTMKIFCSKEESPVPLETQADVQVENIRRGTRKMRINYVCIGAIAWIVGLWFLFCLFMDFAGTVSSSLGCFLGICALSLGCYTVYDFVAYRRWYRRAAENAETTQTFTPTKASRSFLLLTLLGTPGVGVAFWLLSDKTKMQLFLLMFLTYMFVYYVQDILRNRLRKKQIQRGVNLLANYLIAFLLFWCVCTVGIRLTAGYSSMEKHGFQWEQGERWLPLSLEDLTKGTLADDGRMTCHTQGTILLSQLEAEQQKGEEVDLQYVVTKIHADFLYDVTKDAMMKTYRKDQAWKKQSDWELPVGSHGDIYETSVKEGSRMVNRYLLCLSDRIIKLDLSFIPDARQQAVITETLQAL